MKHFQECSTQMLPENFTKLNGGPQRVLTVALENTAVHHRSLAKAYNKTTEQGGSRQTWFSPLSVILPYSSLTNQLLLQHMQENSLHSTAEGLTSACHAWFNTRCQGITIRGCSAFQRQGSNLHINVERKAHSLRLAIPTVLPLFQVLHIWEKSWLVSTKQQSLCFVLQRCSSERLKACDKSIKKLWKFKNSLFINYHLKNLKPHILSNKLSVSRIQLHITFT